MAKQFIYLLLIIAAFISCEKIYIPDLDNVDDLLVVEAILVSGKEQNDIYLYKTLNFNSKYKTYPAVTGAKIKLVDDLGKTIDLTEKSAGTYRLNGLLDNKRSYYLSIELDDDTYISEIQTVPAIPSIDSIYGAFDTRTITSGAADSDEDIFTKTGLQIFTDIYYDGKLNHYRFSGQKILQFKDYYSVPFMGTTIKKPIYCWRTYSLSGTFNIAGPPEYSSEKDIKKHRLEFFNQNYYELIADTQDFAGWIYIIDQYGITEAAHEYYSDLKNQLEAEGKIFDPIYVQVEGNITCSNNPEKVVLGNFEIASHKQYRYLLKYYNKKTTFSIRTISEFHDIPSAGNIKNTPPDFWEY
ncbi:MAG: hypothetical protein A2W90_02195 [Bacteroidetes bacterium GWF2_42_66]|nr:MAG: hypothetical protein A2W92_16985 [Bacteroidetes bacterium GWA2_42_15]OFY01163.1 MAG: hypothetical protein A2W89_15680 [Bacteroidetes bacterium GWE2_42_39]OFY42006.1 MAG: hypothetical protein A2W90_02195 [Bacteroidetes bacterium GWF2_42_66]HBL77795.1 hypothetical protein [Prolixibacteraceae bacterium]HCR90458.1 hypothetical protein [Prolixibacteraceae bacterium]